LKCDRSWSWCYISGIDYDAGTSTLFCYNTVMAGWWETAFDFVGGGLINPSRSFTGIESFFEPFEGYANRFGDVLVIDSADQFSYRVDETGITIARETQAAILFYSTPSRWT